MNIAIVTDGNNQLGLGHVYQSLSLAAALRQRCGAQAGLYFLTRSDESICSLIRQRGFDVTTYPDDAAILRRLQAEQPGCVIFDKLDVAPELARAIKQTIAAKLVIFTNLTPANDYADLAVLADMGSNFQNVRRIDPVSGAIRVNGPRYWILRPEFYTSPSRGPVGDAPVRRLMLMFGGADPANFSSLVLDRLLAMPASLEILLVLGAAFRHDALLQAVLDRHAASSSRVAVRRNVTNVAGEMQSHEVVFASPGLSFFEALAVGTSVLGFHQNALQRDVYATTFPTLGVEDLDKLPEMVQNKQFIHPWSPAIAAMEIGRGKDEILDDILRY